MSQKTLEDLENYGELLLKTTLKIASLTLWKQSVKKMVSRLKTFAQYCMYLHLDPPLNYKNALFLYMS